MVIAVNYKISNQASWFMPSISMEGLKLTKIWLKLKEFESIQRANETFSPATAHVPNLIEFNLYISLTERKKNCHCDLLN